MPYPNQHLYVTFHWSIGAEQGQVGLRFDRATMPGTTEQESARTVTETFWASVGADISSSYVFEFIKFALIQPDGLYPPDVESQIIEATGSIAGGGSVNAFPYQTAAVMGLTTAAVRGRAHRGRIYLPPMDATLSAAGLWGATNGNNRNAAAVTWLNGLKTAIDTNLMVFSKVGAGTKRLITGVQSGLRPDVQRRRAENLPENYVSASL